MLLHGMEYDIKTNRFAAAQRHCRALRDCDITWRGNGGIVTLTRSHESQPPPPHVSSVLEMPSNHSSGANRIMGRRCERAQDVYRRCKVSLLCKKLERNTYTFLTLYDTRTCPFLCYANVVRQC